MPEGFKQVYISDAVHAVVKRKATMEGLSIQALVNDILTRALLPQAAELTDEAIQEKNARGVQEALGAIAKAQEQVASIPKCEVCLRPANLPIHANGAVYCSIGCLHPGMSIPIEAFKVLESLPIVATADGSTGALFYRASLFSKEPKRPAFCPRCGRAVMEGLKVSVPPRHKYCHRCLRPPLWWIKEHLKVDLEPSEGTPHIDSVTPPPEETEKDGPVPEFIEALRPVGTPFRED